MDPADVLGATGLLCGVLSAVMATFCVADGEGLRTALCALALAVASRVLRRAADRR